jgi:hypothetical protein
MIIKRKRAEIPAKKSESLSIKLGLLFIPHKKPLPLFWEEREGLK